MSTRQRRRPFERIADFVHALRASRLIPPHILDELANNWRHSDRPRMRALDLVESRLLTHFQASAILTGRGDRLRLGRYLLLERLSCGGMGQVYKAMHTITKRVVAVKIAARLPGDADRQTVVAQFRHEVEAAATLRHPNIVATLDAGASRRRLFLVMEHLIGTDLGHLILRDGPLECGLAEEILRQIGQALYFADARGMIHRDIEPTNIFLVDNQGPPSVKLLDLGLARHASARELATDPNAADIRDDLHGLGCTLYFLLTGHLPFPHESESDKSSSHQNESPISLEQLRPDVPMRLIEIVARLMAEAPEARFQTPLELLWELSPPYRYSDILPLPIDGLAGARHTIPERTRGKTNTLPRNQRTAATTFPRLAIPQDSLDSAPALRRPAPEDNGFWRSGLSGKLGQVLCAVGLGLVVACGIKGMSLLRGESPIQRIAIPHPAIKPLPFRIEGESQAYASLNQAIAAAPDQGVIIIAEPGPHAGAPIAIRGKALTLRAAAGVRPRLEKITSRKTAPWQGLLTTDRSLTLIGLDLGLGHGAEGSLIVAAGSALILNDCRLTGHGTEAVVVATNPSQVELRGCRIEAGLGLAMEVGEHPSAKLILTRCTISGNNADSCAISVWSPEVGTGTEVTCVIDSVTLAVDRVLCLRGLRGQTRMEARDSTLHFRDALLAFTTMPTTAPWRDRIAWQGTRNRYQPHDCWVTVDGEPRLTGDLDTWTSVWGAESESQEDAGSSVATIQK